MTKAQTIFAGISFNGQELSNSENLAALGKRFMNSGLYDFESDDYWVGSSLVDIANHERNAAIHEKNVAWLADPANYDAEEYSDVFKDTYGYRP